MLGPYREPVLIVADPLPRSCVPEDAPGRVRCPPPARAFPSGFFKALSAAATLLLLVSSASLAAITWTITSTLISAPERLSLHVPEAFMNDRAAARPAPYRARGPLPFDAGTHQVEAIWAREQWTAAQGPWLTLARATVAPGAFAPEMFAGAGAHARVVHEPRGLRLVELDEGSTATLVGLRQGDLITAINGFALRRPDDAVRAYEEVAAGRAVVIELLRNGRPVALRVDWEPVARMK